MQSTFLCCITPIFVHSSLLRHCVITEKRVDSRFNHVDSWSQQGARIRNEDTRFASTTSIPHCNNDFRPSQMMTDHLKGSASSQSILGSSYDPPSTYIQTCIAHTRGKIMLRWSHHVDIFGTLHFIVRCLADRSEGPLPPCSCRRRRCSCTPPASASSPTPAKDIESRPNHVYSWSPAREEPMGKHTYIHTYIIIIIIIMRQGHQLPAQLGLHVVVSSSINKWQCIHTYMHAS